MEAWQIYNILKKGEYEKCACDNGQICVGVSLTERFIYETCFNCKGTGKIKTAWYNHPCTQMWKDYEDCLLLYGIAICKEWIKRGYKDSLLEKFELALAYFEKRKVKIPKWLGNKKFHNAMRSNLLRKDKKYYSKFNWNVVDNLPYIWGDK